MDLKVVDNFLPSKTFNRLLELVESNSFVWIWNNDTYINPVTQKGDNLWMFSQLLFAHSSMLGNFTGGGPGIHPLYPAFQVIEDCQAEIYPFKQVMKVKLNLYPNQGKNISHSRHTDVPVCISSPVASNPLRPNGTRLNKHITTSVFNFHTCNGSTVVEIDGKNNNIPSKANRLILFDNTWHYGITQSDTPRRIVLNLNVMKH